MLSMFHVNNIRDLRKKGSTIKEIAEITHTDPKTVRKYLNQEDFSPQRPVNPERPSILDPFKPIIQKWLDEDKKNWRKQQFTAMRIYHLLQEQEGFTGSYNVVQRYVKKVKKKGEIWNSSRRGPSHPVRSQGNGTVRAIPCPVQFLMPILFSPGRI